MTTGTSFRKANAGMIHSVRGWTHGWQVKLCDSISSCFAAELEKRQRSPTPDLEPFYGATASQKCSGMAHIVKGSHSFTCNMRLSTNGMKHICMCLRSQRWSSFTNARGMEGWVGLGTTMVRKQSAKALYVMAITVVSCINCHASLGNWFAGVMSIKITTSRAASHNTDH